MIFFGRKRPVPEQQEQASEPIIRGYHPRDLKALKAISRATFGDVCVDYSVEQKFGLLNGTSWADRRAVHIEQDVTYWPDYTFVAEIAGEVVGFVTTSLDKFARTGHIRNLAVLSEHQGKGIGRSLIEHALACFKRDGMEYARIETVAQNDRCTVFYPKMGFQEVARQIFYFRKLD